MYVPAYGPLVTIYSDHSSLQFLDKFKLKNVKTHSVEFTIAGI